VTAPEKMKKTGICLMFLEALSAAKDLGRVHEIA